MADHVLFLIHGMGSHENLTWADPVIKKLNETASSYAQFQEEPLSDRVEFVPISYDDIVESALERWKENSQQLAKFAEVNGLKDMAMVPVIEGLANQDKPFFWSHVADVIVYVLLRGYTNLIRLRVCKEIAKVVELRASQGLRTDYSVLAHSLGTAVAHDSLHMLGTEKWGEVESPYAPKHLRFTNIMMLANTSRLLATDIDPFNSIVRSGPNLGNNSNCYRYHTYDHIYDPVGKMAEFDTDLWNIAKPGSVVEHFHDWNYHGFEHYLDNPAVHIPILKAITDKWTISGDETTSAIHDYETIGGKFEDTSDQVNVVVDHLKQIRDSFGQDRDIKKILASFQDLMKEVKDLKEIAGDV